MSRISGALATAFANDPANLFFLAKFEFDSGTIRYTTRIEGITWDGQAWDGVGGLMMFDFPDETGEVRATGGTIELNKRLRPCGSGTGRHENFQGHGRSSSYYRRDFTVVGRAHRSKGVGQIAALCDEWGARAGPNGKSN